MLMCFIINNIPLTGNFQYILKKVDVPVLESNDCEQRLRRTRLGPFFQLSRSSFICAGGELGKDACTVIYKNFQYQYVLNTQ